MTFDLASHSLDLYTNASGRIAVVLDDETLILASGRVLPFEPVADRWEYEHETAGDDLSDAQVEAIVAILADREAFATANAARVDARLAREEAERQRRESAEYKAEIAEMARLMRDFRRAISARA